MDGTESGSAGQHRLQRLTPYQPRTCGHSLCYVNVGSGADAKCRMGQAPRARRGGGKPSRRVPEGSTAADDAPRATARPGLAGGLGPGTSRPRMLVPGQRGARHPPGLPARGTGGGRDPRVWAPSSPCTCQGQVTGTVAALGSLPRSPDLLLAQINQGRVNNGVLKNACFYVIAFLIG